jgi:hypothetical protein
MAQDRSFDDDGTVGLTAAEPPAHPVSDIATRTTPAASLDDSLPDTEPQDDVDGLNFLTPAQGPDELGRLGGYRVLRVLGAGGMGVVLEAADPKLGRHVAMKVMRPWTAGSSRSVERFLREARLAATVEHDHIVPIYLVGEENRVPFIVMPFLKGEPLDARLRREGKLPIAEAVRIARDVAEGLAAAHEAGLVHRDVKPGNLWLEAPRSRVKILDFGLARPGSDDTHLTHSGQIVGTPAYMAPEQGRGRPVDARTDLFSLGGVLYRMVTGRQPFNGPDTMSLLTALATDTPDDPRDHNPDVPPALAALIMRLLEKDPARRPQTAREVVDALSPAIELSPATVPEAEFAFDVEEVTEEMAARPRPAARLGLLAAALLVIGGGGFLGYKLFLETPTGAPVLNDPAVEARFKDGAVQILETRRLTGWAPVGDGTWTARGGVLVGEGADGWLMSDATYQDFELTLEYRLPPGGDGGVFLRAWPDEDLAGGKFLEVQLLDDDAPRDRKFRPDEKNGALYGLTGPTVSPRAPAGEWNALKVRVEGSRVRIAVNGTTTADTDLSDYRHKEARIPGLVRREGNVGLQHCNCRVEYRNVRLTAIGAER